jgi:hypothetical protein
VKGVLRFPKRQKQMKEKNKSSQENKKGVRGAPRKKNIHEV